LIFLGEYDIIYIFPIYFSILFPYNPPKKTLTKERIANDKN